jgi:hypothetical protein
VSSRGQYRDCWSFVRIFAGSPGWINRATAVKWRERWPVDIRRAAARSYNARRYAPVYWTHDNARAKYDDGWLPF